LLALRTVGLPNRNLIYIQSLDTLLLCQVVAYVEQDKSQCLM